MFDEVDKSKNEISLLKLALENATNDLEKLKLENVEQKLTIDIVKAENKSLESEKEHFEFKLNEVSLKLKQKTIQYHSLLKSQHDDCEPGSESRDQSHDESRDESPSDSRKPNPYGMHTVGIGEWLKSFWYAYSRYCRMASRMQALTSAVPNMNPTL